MAPHTKTTARCIGRALAVLLLAVAWSPADAELLETTLTVGEGWAVVREMRRMNVTAGVQEVLLHDIPAEADLASLMIRTRRLSVDILDWERLPTARETVATQSDLAVTRDGRVRPAGQPDAHHDAAPAIGYAGPVRCRIRVPEGGERSMEIVYFLPGLTWSAYYHVFIRGEPDGRDEQVAVDLTGFVRVRNDTGRSFTNALVRLVGADPRLPREPQRQPGFLTLADTPLSFLWEEQAVDPPPEFVYRMPRRVNIPARSDGEIHFINAHRIPSSRLFVMDSEVLPLTLTQTKRPLSQYLVFNNSSANRLGWTLPPGPVEVYHGVVRRTALPPGFLPHTAMNREIRVDLGPVADVVGMRRSTLRTEPDHGFYEEVFQLTIENQRTSPVAVEISERPPVAFRWDVMRATEDLEMDRGRMLMRPRIGGGESHRIEIRLRYHQPAL